MDTILAPASGGTPAGVCVLRLSGPAALTAAARLAGPIPKPRYASRRTLRGHDGEPLDQALVIAFPAPASFTGEDCAELHLHGGSAVVEAVLAALLACPGVRLARAGEFTRRAYENGKMDLAGAEGLADLIEAETEAQRRQAYRLMSGALGDEAEQWREQVLSALADAEADIDFPDEDLPPGLSASARERIIALQSSLVAALAGADAARRVRDGLSVSIIGAPNVGKSTLLNHLAGREAAIVSPVAGTTRDVVEVRLILGGSLVWVADTAGLRDATADAIEAEGVRRALDRAESADLRILMAVDSSGAEALQPLARPGDILLWSKVDTPETCSTVEEHGGWLPVSALTGHNMDVLTGLITERARMDQAAAGAAPMSRLRHAEAVREAIAALARALDAPDTAPELAAEDLRLAARALGRIAGRVDVEDVLDRLFSQFCIGK